MDRSRRVAGLIGGQPRSGQLENEGSLSKRQRHRQARGQAVNRGKSTQDIQAQPLPLAQAHAALLDRAIAMRLGEADNAAVIAALSSGSA